MCHGGIWRDSTRSLMARAHGRASLKVRSDIGAIDPGWWHAWHFASKIAVTPEQWTGAIRAARVESAALVAPGRARLASHHDPRAVADALADVYRGVRRQARE